MRKSMALMGVLAATAAAAQDAGRDSSPDQYLGIVAAYVRVDDQRGVDEDGQGMAVIYGREFRNRWYWEGQLFTNVLETGQSGFTDFYQYGAGLDAHYRFRQGSGFSPFLLAGLGAVHNDVVPNGDDATNLYGNVGLGFVTRELGSVGLRLRAEVRYIRDGFEAGGESGMDDWRFGLGLQIPLGRRIVEKEVVRTQVVTETVRVPAEIEDEDGDGVPDQIDRCPGTSAGALTNNRGCVPNSPDPVRLKGVGFETNSARLTPGAMIALQEVASSLRGTTAQAEVAGHTDSAGAAEDNQRLSESRAQAVVDFLAGEGIDPGRLRARGYGESRPIADNDTAEGRRQNRRVELQILD